MIYILYNTYYILHYNSYNELHICQFGWGDRLLKSNGVTQCISLIIWFSYLRCNGLINTYIETNKSNCDIYYIGHNDPVKMIVELL